MGKEIMETLCLLINKPEKKKIIIINNNNFINAKKLFQIQFEILFNLEVVPTRGHLEILFEILLLHYLFSINFGRLELFNFNHLHTNYSHKLMMMMKKKKKNNNNNKEIIHTIEQDHFTVDLILEILSRLPPITLLRFKSVSKTWYSLISNPDFLRRHTAFYHHCSDDDAGHHMLGEPFPPPGILFGRHFHTGDSKLLILPPLPCGYDHQQQNHALLLQKLIDYRPQPLNELLLLLLPSSPSSVPGKKESCFMLIDSCNGLLLYVQSNSRSFYVCNPITEDYIKLPTIDIVDIDIDEEQDHEKKIAQIVFNNPASSFSALTYKVFTWVQCVKRSSSRSNDSSNYYYRRLYVYSSETRSWRLSVSIPITEFPLFFNFDLKAVLWNGVLHWTTLLGGIDDALSLCYDIENETVWTMKFPKMAMGYTHRTLLYFGECGGRLLMIDKHYRDDEVNWFPSTFNVMEKQQQQRQNSDKDDDDVWTVRYRVSFDEVDNNYYSELIRRNSLLGVYIFDIYRTMRTNKGEEEEMLLMKIGSDRIISFNLTSNTFEKKELRNRKTGLANIGSLFYTDILLYTITLYPP